MGQKTHTDRTFKENHAGRLPHQAVVEKKMKARGPGQPCGKANAPKTPPVAYDIKEWM